MIPSACLIAVGYSYSTFPNLTYEYVSPGLYEATSLVRVSR